MKKGAININVLWEMGGAQQVLEGGVGVDQEPLRLWGVGFCVVLGACYGPIHS